MSFFLGNISLALIWMFLMGFNGTNFIVGMIIGHGLMLLSRRTSTTQQYSARVGRIIRFIAFFIREIVVANIQVARLVLQPRLNIRPAIVAVPLEVTKDTEITLLSNLLSLTPGSLNLEISHNARMMYVHGIDVQDDAELIASVKKLEAQIMEIVQ